MTRGIIIGWQVGPGPVLHVARVRIVTKVRSKMLHARNIVSPHERRGVQLRLAVVLRHHRRRR